MLTGKHTFSAFNHNMVMLKVGHVTHPDPVATSAIHDVRDWIRTSGWKSKPRV